jgi:hypothetical protein
MAGEKRAHHHSGETERALGYYDLLIAAGVLGNDMPARAITRDGDTPRSDGQGQTAPHRSLVGDIHAGAEHILTGA